MTKLELINKIVLQWFFVRLTKHMGKDKDGKYTIVKKWSLQYWILPLSGWWSQYVYLNKKPKFLYL